jgi:hypothetical protein
VAGHLFSEAVCLPGQRVIRGRELACLIKEQRELTLNSLGCRQREKECQFNQKQQTDLHKKFFPFVVSVTFSALSVLSSHFYGKGSQQSSNCSLSLVLNS